MKDAQPNTARILEAFDFASLAETQVQAQKTLSLSAFRFQAAPRHARCIKRVDVERKRKAEHSKWRTACHYCRDFHNGSADLKAAGARRVFVSVEPAMSGLRFRSPGNCPRVRRKNQSGAGQRGRQSRPESRLRNPIRPDTALLRWREAARTHRGHREQGSGSRQTQTFAE